MSTQLPACVVAFLQAQDARDSAALAACFAEDGAVYDDGRTISGRAAIAAWNDWANREYQLRRELIGAEMRDSGLAVLLKTSGNFAGSPVTFTYTFTLAGAQIASLEIGI